MLETKKRYVGEKEIYPNYPLFTITSLPILINSFYYRNTMRCCSFLIMSFIWYKPPLLFSSRINFMLRKVFFVKFISFSFLRNISVFSQKEKHISTSFFSPFFLMFQATIIITVNCFWWYILNNLFFLCD